MRVLPVLFFLLLFPASAAANGPASVRVLQCVSALEPSQRHAIFEGDMRAVRGSARMQMRFTLYARAPREGWGRVPGTKLDTWMTSDGGKKGYVYDKRVDGLLAPAGYRVRVRYRWLDGDGKVLARAKRVSRVCRQQDLRPDLRLVGVDRQDGAYAITVRNAGRSAADAFGVTLTVPGAPPRSARATSLAAGAKIVLRIEGKACEPGSTLQVALDAADEVDEIVEDAAALPVPCPVRP